jgi:hypothetical protein
MGDLLKSENRDTVALELPANVAVALKKEARRSHRSMTELATQAVADFLEDREDYRDAVAAKKLGGKSTPVREVFRRLELGS